MNLPKNVWWFEVLLYASLLLDALSLAFQDRTPGNGMSEQMIAANTLFSLLLLPLFLFLIWLAARRRKSWPRWVLSAALAYALIGLAQVIGERGVQLDVAVDIVSWIMAVSGIYLSLTGDAKDWFDA